MNTLPVTFHNHTLYIIKHDGEPYTPMKPIVDGMGLDWRSQQAKLSANPARYGMVKITIPVSGAVSEQEMLCIPLRKLFGWLCTISPNKVKPELKDRIIQYQNECDEVLYQHWTQSQQKPKHQHYLDGSMTVDIGTGRTAEAGLVDGEPYLTELQIEHLIDYRLRRSVRKVYGAHEHEFPANSVLFETFSDGSELLYFSPAACVIIAAKSTKPQAVLLQLWAVNLIKTLLKGKVLVDREELEKLTAMASKNEEHIRTIARYSNQICAELSDAHTSAGITKIRSQQLAKG